MPSKEVELSQYLKDGVLGARPDRVLAHNESNDTARTTLRATRPSLT